MMDTTRVSSARNRCYHDPGAPAKEEKIKFFFVSAASIRLCKNDKWWKTHTHSRRLNKEARPACQPQSDVNDIGKLSCPAALISGIQHVNALDTIDTWGGKSAEDTHARANVHAKKQSQLDSLYSVGQVQDCHALSLPSLMKGRGRRGGYLMRCTTTTTHVSRACPFNCKTRGKKPTALSFQKKRAAKTAKQRKIQVQAFPSPVETLRCTTRAPI